MNRPEFKIDQENYRIAVEDKEHVSALLDSPSGYVSGGTLLILSHGAGNDMTAPLLQALSAGLARAGLAILRFNFPYKEKGKKAPDPPDRLMQTWRSALEFARARFSPKSVIAAGKSMGGRIASHTAAEGALPVDGLIYYGYPLHPPGRKDKPRDAHLYEIHIPMLFFAGTRDALCDLDLLKRVLGRIDPAPDLEIIDGGDHSFRVLKSLGIDESEISGRLVEKTVSWIENLKS